MKTAKKKGPSPTRLRKKEDYQLHLCRRPGTNDPWELWQLRMTTRKETRKLATAKKEVQS